MTEILLLKILISALILIVINSMLLAATINNKKWQNRFKISLVTISTLMLLSILISVWII